MDLKQGYTPLQVIEESTFQLWGAAGEKTIEMLDCK